MIAYLPLVFLILGLLFYLAPFPAKVCEVGRIAYFVGLLVLVLSYAGRSVRLL